MKVVLSIHSTPAEPYIFLSSPALPEAFGLFIPEVLRRNQTRTPEYDVVIYFIA